MRNYSLYSDEIWDRFLKKTGDNNETFELKTYPQFDPFFNFSKRSSEIKDLVKDPTLQKINQHRFIPFVKILTKTPRYRFQENEKSYGLETKIRPIAFASHFDTYIYSFYSFALNEKYQNYIRSKQFNDCILAYRNDLNGKCNIQFAKEVFDEVIIKYKKNDSCTAIALDITGYFDNIDHEKLKEKWCKIIGLPELPIDQYKVFKSLTKYSYVNKNSILNHFKINLVKHKKDKHSWTSLLDLIPNNIAGPSFTEKFNLLRERNLIVTNLPKQNKNKTLSNKGIPQGSAISALLSNIYLIDFDEWLFDLSIKNDFIYRRYCDDLLIICNCEFADEINQLVLKKIKEYELKIQDKKTELIQFKKNSKGVIRGFNLKKIKLQKIKINSNNEQQYYKNLQYLGFEFSGQNIYIRPGSLSRYFRKMKGRIVKTIMMAYNKKSTRDKISKKQLYDRYSNFGNRNFITYAQNASKKEYSNSKGIKRKGMDSISIKRQLAAHFSILEKEVIKTSEQRAFQKNAKFIKY